MEERVNILFSQLNSAAVAGWELQMKHLSDDHIRAFVIENFLFGDSDRVLGPDDSLIKNDIVDSTGILELVAFIEDRYGILVADAEIVPENFDTIASLSRFVSSKTAQAAVA